MQKIKQLPLGYVVDCRYDILGEVGIHELYDNRDTDDYHIVYIRTAVDANGKIVKPLWASANDGFILLTVAEQAEVRKQEIVQFVRSHKPYFSKVSDIMMLVQAKLYYDKKTKELIQNKSVVTFFVPKQVKENIGGIESTVGDPVPVLLCNIASSASYGVNVEKISTTILNSYKNAFLSFCKYENVKNREDFLLSRSEGRN